MGYLHYYYKRKEFEVDTYKSVNKSYQNEQLHSHSDCPDGVHLSLLMWQIGQQIVVNESLPHSVEMLTAFGNDRVESRWSKCATMVPGGNLLIVRYVPLLV